MTQKLTPWFDGSVKPVHVGVYQRQIPRNSYAYWRWNGEFWQSGGIGSAEYAAGSCPIPSHDQELPWRGLAVKP